MDKELHEFENFSQKTIFHRGYLKTLYPNFENGIFGKRTLSGEKREPFGLPSTFGSINEKRYIRYTLYP